MKCFAILMDWQFANLTKKCLDHRNRQQHQCKNSLLQRIYRRGSCTFIIFLFFISAVCPVRSVNFNDTNQDFRPKKMKLVRAHLAKINKPSVKTIQACSCDMPYSSVFFCPVSLCFVLFYDPSLNTVFVVFCPSTEPGW